MGARTHHQEEHADQQHQSTHQRNSSAQFKSIQSSNDADPHQLQKIADDYVEYKAPIQKKEKPNNTGLPDQLKTGIENLSGYSMDDVKVHYNSNKPAQLQAHAYAQGNQIHIAPGQKKHLPHEAWHVVQQKQGRVKPTTELHGTSINDSPQLEKEADIMGNKAIQFKGQDSQGLTPRNASGSKGTQLVSTNDYSNHSTPDEGVLIQRLALPLDDLQALAGKGKIISDEEAASARIMTESVGNRVHATDEDVARPHQIADEDNGGGLSKIGLTEELRIFGHGATTRISQNEAVQVGGYTPRALADLLVNMGLPKSYQGEIYLSGCLSAVGPNNGFLGKFYGIIKDHSPGVIVRGNLGNSTTFSDGTQGVWSSKVTKEEYSAQIKAFGEMAAEVYKQIDNIGDKVKSGELTILEAQQKLKLATEQIESLSISKDQYNKVVYDTTGSYTITLPSKDIQASNAIKAVVSGAITSSADVDKLLNRITDDNLDAAKQTLDEMLTGSSESIDSLIKQTEDLIVEPVKFK